MARWSKKFTLLDLYRCGYLNDVLPQVSSRYKWKVKENKVYKKEDLDEPTGTTKSLKNAISTEGIEKQIKNNVMLRVNDIKSAGASKGVVNFYVKARSYNSAVDTYNDIVREIKAMKSTLAYVNAFQAEIETALRYSITREMNDEDVPKVALKINSLSQLKGMTTIQKKHVVENIIESIVFDDKFKAPRSYAKTNMGRYEDTLDKEHKYKYWKTLKKDYDLRVERYVYDNGKMKAIKE